MTHDHSRPGLHPAGEQSLVAREGSPPGVVVDSFAGPVRVEWDHEASFTPLGQLPFFIDFLKTAGLFEAFVADCPLRYTSPNAPKTRDVLGTAMLSMLAGHKRYAHIAALRGDGVLPELLDMTKIVSEDSVRRAFAAIEEEAGAAWLRRHLDHCLEPLLSEPWILDIDTTVKPLYGHQEGAVVGYNPKKPGRPSHVYHTYSMAGARLVFDVDVCAGDEHTSNHAAPGLWALLDRTPRDCWPCLLRGDKGFGNEGILREAERRGLPYLFKLRLTANIKRAIERLSGQRDWVDSGQGWQAKETEVRLQGWSRHRRVIVLRRRVKGALVSSLTDEEGQRRLAFADIGPGEDIFEYQVVATSLVEELASFGQLYRDRADGENIFDELKNQWGWGGFVTHDLARCRLAARLVALFYDWWNIFVRLAEPDWHREAITSRPLLLHAIAERVRHARQTTIKIASTHARSVPAAAALRAVAAFLRSLARNAEQLNDLQRWREILSRAFQAFLKGRPLRFPARLKPG
jgi:Transposase DDE domain group 1